MTTVSIFVSTKFSICLFSSFFLKISLYLTIYTQFIMILNNVLFPEKEENILLFQFIEKIFLFSIRKFSRLKSLISSVNVVRLVAPIIERKHKMCINIGDYFIIVLYSSMQSNQILMVCKKQIPEHMKYFLWYHLNSILNYAFL